MSTVATAINGRSILRVEDRQGEVHLIEALSTTTLCGEDAAEMTPLRSGVGMNRHHDICYRRLRERRGAAPAAPPRLTGGKGPEWGR